MRAFRGAAARQWLIVLDGFVAITATGGGIALAAGLERGRFPQEWLRGTPFRSYTLPGVLLACVVGGSATIAVGTMLRTDSRPAPASTVAGSLLLGWVAGEVALLKQPHRPTPIEFIYFVVGLLMVVLSLMNRRPARMAGGSPPAHETWLR